MTASTDVAIVGGGPAGALTAMLLARRGLEVVVLERAPQWRWRACGVFTSPATVMVLRDAGVAPADLVRVARPIPTMRVETPRGTSFALSYGGTHETGGSSVGLDRSALDPLLLVMAGLAGAEVRQGVAVDEVDLLEGRSRGGGPGARSTLALSDGGRLAARVVVGADGPRSLVATAAGVAKSAPLGRRIGLSFHVPERANPPVAAGAQIGVDSPREARMVIIEDGYIGLAPVPGGRVNVGIVLGSPWQSRLRAAGASAVATTILERVLPAEAAGIERQVLDHVAGAVPLGAAVRRRAGAGWLLVGDAAGFLDPFTGDGLHRSVVSARVADDVIARALARPGTAYLAEHDRAMRAQFGRKDLVSRLVHVFLSQPALFEYAARRLAARRHVRETMGLVIGDLLPASRALDPRFLAALLAP